MGKFKCLVDTPAAIEAFRARYRIPQGVVLKYCPPDRVLTDIIAFIEGGMTLPMHRIARDYLINHKLIPYQCAPNLFKVLGYIDALNEQMGLRLTWHEVVHMYECHKLASAGYYLKSQSQDVKLILCLPKSNKGMKDDYLIASGEWSDGLHCPTRARDPGVVPLGLIPL